jgi:hypothetical protein
VRRERNLLCAVLLIAALVAGTSLRAWRAGSRPFWQDEAWVADAVTHRTFGDLMTQTDIPLPPLFAVTIKVLGQAIGPPELGLRLLPLLCGLSVPLLAYVAARAARAPRLLAVGGAILCACSLGLVIWGRELKQYAVEAALATLAAWLIFRLAYWTGPRRPTAIATLILLCVAGPWLGYSLVFALTALLVGLGLTAGAGRRGRLLLAAGNFVVLTVSTVALLYTAAAGQGRQPALVQFWQRWCIDLTSVRSWARAGYFAGFSTTQMLLPVEWFGTLDRLSYVIVGAAIWGLAVYGLWSWPRRSRALLACWTIGPWLLMAAAAVAQHYPFAMQRMVIYTAPALMITLAAGVIRASRACSAVLLGRHGPGMVAGALILFLPALYVRNVPLYGSYWSYHDYPSLLAALNHQRQPGEPVWVTQDAAPAVRYYSGDGLRPAFIYPTAAGSLPDPSFDQREAMWREFRWPGRYWLITTDRTEEHRTELMAWLRREGFRLEMAGRFGASSCFNAPQLYRVWRP